ncbi:hypothetical protein [Candidatus Ichthyocystis sparus]|uniref:hypothetical protein n=1 Tax=Candidatus Ichthyocystis sparus TaxID=1561004 RepID=UPI001F5ED206|nr:hypothetical protein [Candidatus Ichthyocystis sparus]
MKRKLSSSNSKASSLNGSDDGLGGLGGQAQPSSALSLEQSTGSTEAGGFLLDPHLSRILGMQPGERIFRSMFHGSPLAPCVSALVAQLLTRQEALLSRGSGEGSSSVGQAGVMESMDLAERNASVIQALMDSVEIPAPAAAPAVVTEGSVGYMHWQDPGAPYPQDPGASRWQDPGVPYPQDPGASHWQDPGVPYPQNPGASHWQDPGVPYPQNPGTSHWQNPGAPYPQDPGTSHWQDPSVPYPQDPGASLWQDPGAPYPQDPGASLWQDPGAPYAQQTPIVAKQSGRGSPSHGGLILPADLAQSLGMQPDQMLFRGMFYNTPQSNTVLGVINQLSEIQLDLLRNLELEIAGVARQEVIGPGCENTASLITTNEELLKALKASIEAPTALVPTMIIEESATGPEEKLLPELEEERNRKLVKSRTKLYTKEQEERKKRKEEERAEKLRKKEEEKEEKLRKKEEELRKKEEEAAKRREKSAAKKREEELRVSIDVAVSRGVKLERVKSTAREITERMIGNLEVARPLSLGRTDIEDTNITEVKRELMEVLVGPRTENLQEMEKELEKVRERCKELKQAGEGCATTEMDEVVTREKNLMRDINSAISREKRRNSLEKELEILVAQELMYEMWTSKEELDKVRMKKTVIEEELAKVRATVAAKGKSLDLKIKLDRLTVKKKEIEARIDRNRRKIELNRLREEGKEESRSDVELNLMLRLEGIRARVRKLELELELWLGKMEAKKTETMNMMITTSLVSDRTETIRRAREEEVEMLKTLLVLVLGV